MNKWKKIDAKKKKKKKNKKIREDEETERKAVLLFPQWTQTPEVITSRLHRKDNFLPAC